MLDRGAGVFAAFCFGFSFLFGVPSALRAAGDGRLGALAITTDGIHVAIPFDYCYSAPTGGCGTTYLGHVGSLAGQVDAVWGAREPVIGAGVSTFSYFDPDVDGTYRGGPRTVSGNTAYQYYVNSGHADWMVFQGGFNKKKHRDCAIAPKIFNSKRQFVTSRVNQNLAWESYSNANNIGRVPLDFNNPGVLSLQTSQLTASIKSGYAGIALDSIHLTNPFGRCGVFRQVKGRWKWTPIYTANHSYASSLINWMKLVRQSILAADAQALLTMNVGLPSDASPMLVLPYTDLFFDERGFTDWGTRFSTNAEWRTVVQLIDKVQGQGRGVLINAEVPGASDKAVNERSILWALANYLLVKGSHSYTYVSPTTATHQGYGRYFDRPEYHIAIGQPAAHGNTGTAMYPQGSTGCWARNFTGGMALVNPSNKKTCSVQLAATYHSIIGHTSSGVKTVSVSHSLKLAPASGAILLLSAA